jgi:hypothetical protein
MLLLERLRQGGAAPEAAPEAAAPKAASLATAGTIARTVQLRFDAGDGEDIR